MSHYNYTTAPSQLGTLIRETSFSFIKKLCPSNVPSSLSYIETSNPLSFYLRRKRDINGRCSIFPTSSF